MLAPTISPFGLATVLLNALIGMVGFGAHVACLASETSGIYLVEHEGEAIHLTDQASHVGARLLIEREIQRADEHSHSSSAKQRLPAALTDIIRAAASAHRVTPELLQAVIAVESGYVVHAVSARGARGLMQLLPATARDYGVTDIFDPRQNVHAGAQHLRRLLDQFGQNTTLALAAYNAGAAAVVRHRHRVPPFAETAAYVPRVVQQLALLRATTDKPAATGR